jgi:hypothetical protein
MECQESFVNSLMLYTLTPGSTVAFKDVRLCNEICPGTQDMEFPLSYIERDLKDEEAKDVVVVYDDPFTALMGSNLDFGDVLLYVSLSVYMVAAC